MLIAAPAVMTALGLAAIEVRRLRQPESPLFATPFAYSLADAIERDDVRRAYAFVVAGQNPDEPIAVRHPVLTSGRWVQVSPLFWAVAVDSRQAVLMLLGFGAHPDRATGRRAACLAEALGHQETARLLRLYSDTPLQTPCPDARSTSGPPLLSFLAEPG